MIRILPYNLTIFFLQILEIYNYIVIYVYFKILRGLCQILY